MPSSTSRKLHLRRLNDILHLSLERGDLTHARRAWAILAECKEFDWKIKWKTSLQLFSDPYSQQESGRSLELLRKVMRYYPVEQEAILQEIILILADSGKFREALDELDLYLPLFPYQENPVLHFYAGLFSLKLAIHISPGSKSQYTHLLSEARNHFTRALSIDPDNLVAKAFSEDADKQLARAKATSLEVSGEAPSDEETDIGSTDAKKRGKRLRRTAIEE